jgi:hypothetical protein
MTLDELNSGEFQALGPEMLDALRHFSHYLQDTILTKRALPPTLAVYLLPFPTGLMNSSPGKFWMVCSCYWRTLQGQLATFWEIINEGKAAHCKCSPQKLKKLLNNIKLGHYIFPDKHSKPDPVSNKDIIKNTV